MTNIFSQENIDKVHRKHYANKLREFHSTKCGLRSSHTNCIQSALVQLMKWNNHNYLNNVPNLEATEDLNNLLNYVRNISYDESLIDNFQYMNPEFIQKYGLKQYTENKIISGKLMTLMSKIMEEKIYEVFLNYLSKEEFELGFEIYRLEKNVPKKLFDYFLIDPGINNIQFNTMEVDIFEIMKIETNNEFLWHLSQIGVNENYDFFYDSEAVRYYNSSQSIQKQSLEIRNQIKNAYNKINNELYYLYITD